MDENIDEFERDLLEIINSSREKKKSYAKLFEDKKSSVLVPLQKDYENLENKLSIKLQTYESALSQFTLTLEKANDSISPIKKHMQQLKVSSGNVKKSLSVVESLISLHDSLSGIKKSLEVDNIEESCIHINKALSSTPNLKNMRGQHQNELLEVQNQVYERLVKDLENSDDPKAILKYRRLFAMIGKKDEGIEIYADFLSNRLKLHLDGIIDLNLKHCVLVPKKEEDTTVTDLLSEVLDYCAASIEQHRPFVQQYYGVSRVKVLVKKIGDVSNVGIERICLFCVSECKRQKFKKKRDISILIDELAVIYQRTKRFQDWIEETMNLGKNVNNNNNNNEQKTKNKKKKEEYSVTIMKLFIDLSDNFLISSVKEIWEKFLFKQNLLELLPRESRQRVYNKYREKTENEKRKKKSDDIRSSSGSTRSTHEEEEENSEEEDEEEEEEEGEEEFEVKMMDLSGYDPNSGSKKKKMKNEEKKNQEVSEVVFDFFFVLKRVMETGFLTSDTQIVCVFINKIYDILSTTIQSYLGKFHSHFCSSAIPPDDEIANNNNNNNRNKYPFQLQGSKFYPSKTRKMFNRCFISLNNIYQTSKYTIKFKKEVQKRCSRYKNLIRQELIDATLNHLDTSSKSYQKLFEEFLSSIMKILSEYIFHVIENYFRNMNYEMSEDKYDLFSKGGMISWVTNILPFFDNFFKVYKEVMLEDVFEAFVGKVVEVSLERIKELVMDKKFTIFGGYRFDEDVRELMKYFGKLVSGSIRGKFTVIGQYTAILRAEKKEDLNSFMTEYFQLPDDEIKRIQNLRIDY